MIDYINVTLEQSGIAKQLRQNNLLAFKEEKTNNGNSIWKASYYNMKFSIYEPSNTVKVAGSLHYLFNEGVHNWNDFKRLDLYDTIQDFCEKFGINSQKAILHSFEFGVNVPLPFSPSLFLESILSYKKSILEQQTSSQEKKDIVYAKFLQYQLKAYNKSLQFGKENENLLRFEVKIKKMVKVKSINSFSSLNDLCKIESLEKLGVILMKEFNGMIVSEPIDLHKMSIAEVNKFEKMKSRQFWKEIQTKAQRRNYTASMERLISKYGNGLKAQISLLISNKWGELLEHETRLNLLNLNISFLLKSLLLA